MKILNNHCIRVLYTGCQSQQEHKFLNLYFHFSYEGGFDFEIE